VLYVWVGDWAVLEVLSPKSHAHVVTVPVVPLVNVTFRGAVPLVGVMVKFAIGAAALTVIGVEAVLDELPPGPVAVSFTV
jgi:hypothetical protein